MALNAQTTFFCAGVISSAHTLLDSSLLHNKGKYINVLLISSGCYKTAESCNANYISSSERIFEVTASYNIHNISCLFPNYWGRTLRGKRNLYSSSIIHIVNLVIVLWPAACPISTFLENLIVDQTASDKVGLGRYKTSNRHHRAILTITAHVLHLYIA